MSSVLDLPTEVLDHVFEYLTTADLKQAVLVCSQWHGQLSAPRFWRRTKLRVTPYILSTCAGGDILLAAARNRHQSIEVSDFFALNGAESRRCTDALVQLLHASRLSLQDLALVDCSQEMLNVTFGGALREARQLRHLRVSFHRAMASRVSLPQVPSTVNAGGLAFVKHLDVVLANHSCAALVSSLAAQLTHLTLTVHRKDLLVWCWNEIQLPALRSLTVATANAAEIDFIQPGELQGGCWRTLAQLEAFRCADATLLYLVLGGMLRHCRRLQRLAIEDCNISAQCVEQIGSLESLQDLRLNVFRNLGPPNRAAPTLNLPKLEHLHLSTENGVRLGTQLASLSSVVIENPLRSFCPKALLSEVQRIQVESGSRRLRTLLLKHVTLDREAVGCLASLAVDGLYFENCRIDGYFLQLLAESTTRRVGPIVMDDCLVTITDYRVGTLADLRARCPHLQLSASGTQTVFV